MYRVATEARKACFDQVRLAHHAIESALLLGAKRDAKSQKLSSAFCPGSKRTKKKLWKGLAHLEQSALEVLIRGAICYSIYVTVPWILLQMQMLGLSFTFF